MFYTDCTDILPFPVRLISDGVHLTGLTTGRTGKEFPELPEARERPEPAVFAEVRRWLEDYAAGRKPEPERVPLAPEGSHFARTVWEILLTIPYGATMTYGEVARRAALRMGKTRMAAQAVGQAVGANPIAIVIPCHRVVGADGKLTGYRGGLGLKALLLHHENIKNSQTLQSGCDFKWYAQEDLNL